MIPFNMNEMFESGYERLNGKHAIVRTCGWKKTGCYFSSLGGEESAIPGQGSGGNVLAALCSFFIPGFGATVARAFVASGYSVYLGYRTMVCAAWLDHSFMVCD